MHNSNSINEVETNKIQNNNSFLFSDIFQNSDLDNSIIFNSIYEDEKFKSFFEPSLWLKDYIEIKKNNIPKRTKSTEAKTYQRNEENDEPKLYTSNDILIILSKYVNSANLKLNFNKNIAEDLRLTRSKRKLDYFEYIDTIKDNKIKMSKRGRKKKNSNKVGVHDKICSDNIIKKVKSAIFNYILYFLNNILSLTNDHVKLAKINYKYVDVLKKEKEFETLNMSLKEIFSKDISPKLKKYNSNFNKQVIDNLLENEKVNDTILFVFNMTLRNWLDIFTLKKSVIEIINEYKDKNYKNIDSEKIEKCLVGVDKLLNEIKEKNSEDYLPYFIFCLYNYERWFYLKKARNNKTNNY